MINIHWPAGGCSPFNPWYVIAWRALWAPVVYLGVAITFVGLLCGTGDWDNACEALH